MNTLGDDRMGVNPKKRLRPWGSGACTGIASPPAARIMPNINRFIVLPSIDCR